MATSVIPQSRSEQILAATINGEEYNQPPQSRIEQLLIELKEAVEEGGGGGGGTDNYNALSNKPQINGVTLSGNKSLADLGIMTEISKVMAMISGTFDATVGYSKDDVVIYDEKLYQFKADHAAGPWDSTEVDQVTIADLLKQSSGSVGGISFDKIWENPASEESISATDITIPSVAAYEKFLVIYKLHKQEQYPKFSSVIFKRGCPGVGFMISVSSNKINLGLRDFDIIDDTTFHVGTCRVAQGSLDASVNAAYCIPYILYGINETAGGGSGVSLNYNQLINRPVVNSHTLEGNKTGSDYGVIDEADSLTSAQIDALIALLS